MAAGGTPFMKKATEAIGSGLSSKAKVAGAAIGSRIAPPAKKAIDRVGRGMSR